MITKNDTKWQHITCHVTYDIFTTTTTTTTTTTNTTTTINSIAVRVR